MTGVPTISQVAAERPDAFEAIVEIFGAAPRLGKVDRAQSGAA